ncbi:MAG TPA: DNA-deoxyinosine glycosylase [Bacteroidia bacterium]|jgi:hypoxanthine-DNA glycosylase|nr:DNA-deoxyinosine glycosylase [Bacteroidia bacterium]HMU20455.1 DNA-deoxyinosine glycosylase [Bacteroidia bacterium]
MNAITKFLDDYLTKSGKTSIDPVEANSLLDREGILRDNKNRPGKPLRDLLRKGQLPHAFQAEGKGSNWIIPHSSKGKSSASNYSSAKQPTVKTQTQPRPVVTPTPSNHSKKSFAPLATDDIEILILGTMPGDKSLELGEYYAHPRNRFWKIIAKITDEQIPTSYTDKQKLLERNKIGLWDVAEAADRKGSLDSDIFDATPNDLESFVLTHDKIKVIGFNGTKAQTLFAMFFQQNPNITYFVLPSTSPANTGITFNVICNQWRLILKQKKKPATNIIPNIQNP